MSSMDERVSKITDIFQWWTKWTGLRWWQIDLRFMQHNKASAYGDGYVALAEATTAWQYLSATVRVFKPALKLVKDEDLEYMIVHELVHVLVNELAECTGAEEDKDKHRDRVTTLIAWALIWVRDRAREEAYEELGVSTGVPTENRMTASSIMGEVMTEKEAGYARRLS